MNENEWNVSNLVWKQHGRNGMEWNGMYLSKGKEWKRMEWNGMYLSKGKELKRME